MWPLKKWNNENWVWVEDVFTKEELDTIVSMFVHKEAKEGQTGDNLHDTTIRDSMVTWVDPSEETRFIYEKLTRVTEYFNGWFNYDLEYIETAQFTTYQINQHYSTHKDMGYDTAYSRKLSLVLQLTDEDEYEGGELCLYSTSIKNPEIMKKKRGRIVGFPSWMLHEVKPVTKGTRHSLVAWVHGAKFK